MAVLVGVGDAHGLAAVELHPARTLHLEEEGFDRIVDPDQLLAGEAGARSMSARVL
jgi:hypothetical protein